LDDFDQRVGLGSLAAPSGRETGCDPDVMSLVTDDLLTLPADGSLPFVQPSPLMSEHQSSEWNRQSRKTSFCPYQTSSLNTESGSSLQENGKAVGHQNPHRDFSEEKHSVYRTPERCDSASEGSSRALSLEENSNKNYPSCLTIHKSDFSVSQVSSIPDFHYPDWLKSYKVFSDSTEERDGENLDIQGETSSSQTFEMLEKGPSVDKDSSNFLEKNGWLDPRGDDEVGDTCSYDSPEACFPFDHSFSRPTKKLFREDQLELLILKADRGLESSAEHLSNMLENDGSPSITDILGAERSWENGPGAFKPPVPVCCEDMDNALPFPKADIIHKFLEDCLEDKNKENTFPGGHHHRPLETSKLMLFKFQAIQGSLSQNEIAEQNDEFEKLSEKAEAALKLCDSEIMPLTNSVQKALLHHLSCLESLVEDNNDQQEQTGDQEDKQGKKE
ncbi:PREDICTED: lung adenoma susceptibility protein 2, partial [Eurypyga helias]|uniref:lung adenoma susceptibility protein 2 n=1 Tax=Eurypyga helias TaxID=54383 RepID=UPI0005291166